ncbi:MAG: putative quinol monooxygenase [Flavisolibacter sp.]
MHVRLTFCKFLPDRIKEAKRIYKHEILPSVKKLKGNLDAHLLEPSDASDDFISITEWKTIADAEAYESSGLYKSMVNKLEGLVMKEPVSKTFTTEETVITAFEQW